MFLVAFILSFLSVSIVSGWGPIGHSLVAQIAQSLLTNQSQTFTRNHLPWYTTGNLSMVSSWPDTIIYPESNPVDYLNWQWSKELHYVDTPDWLCVYDRNRDCNWTDGQRCVDGAIQNYSIRLADAKEDDVQRQEALKFLVHFIGDVHQPLHAGFAGDRGGNSINVTFFDKKANLHKIWDTLMIDRRISLDFHDDPNEYYNYLLNILHTTYAKNITEWSTCPSTDEAQYLACSTAWIKEDMGLNCAYVYRDENNNPMNSSEIFDLGQIYYNTRIIFLEQRLLQGGVRLGIVINKIVELQKHHHKEDDNQLSVGTLFFVIIILLEGVLLLSVAIYYTANRRRYSQPLAALPPAYHTYDPIKK